MAGKLAREKKYERTECALFLGFLYGMISEERR